MYADVGLKQTAVNVVLQVLPHLVLETNRLIRELPAGWGCQPPGRWAQGSGLGLLRDNSHAGGTEETEARGPKGTAQRATSHPVA